MQNIKNKFSENEWDMIQHILKNGKGQSSWYELAVDFQIRIKNSKEQRKKASNDVWRKYLKLTNSNIEKQSKVLIYDIETSKTPFELWWSGKQFVNGNSAMDDSKIVTISYKWLGSDIVHSLTWDYNKCDKTLIEEFLEVYNKADMIVGINNDKFDNKFINTRAAKFNLTVNLHVKSLDIQKECRKLFRLPSYSMRYLGRYFEVPIQKMKVHLEDIWEDLVYGTKEESKKAMCLLVEYNVQDILTTEQLYLRLQRYLKHPVHFGVLNSKENTNCPICGSNKVELFKTNVSLSGNIERIMKCVNDGHLFKINNSQYLKL